MTSRRQFLVTAGIVILCRQAGAQGQKLWRIGYLATHPAWTPYFHSAMKSLGYSEGKDLAVIWRVSDENPAHLRAIAQELVALGVDLIFVDSTPGALAAKSVTDR